MVTIKYKKTADAVYVSHIDIYRAIYRGIRRANLDVAYSKGYNPHAELFLSPPLPLFVYSDCEYFTADTKEDADEFFAKYSASAHDLLPPISRFYTAKNPNLAGKIFSADYLLEFSNPTRKITAQNADDENKTTGKIADENQISKNQTVENQATEKIADENQTSKNQTVENQATERIIDENQSPKIMNEAVEKLLSLNEIIFTNRNGKSKNIRPYIYSAELADYSPTIEQENYILKINIDSTNLRAETIAAEIERLSDLQCAKITKTAQYVKIDAQIIDADEYLSSLYSLV
jgi:radical SAM-linked protein